MKVIRVASWNDDGSQVCPRSAFAVLSLILAFLKDHMNRIIALLVAIALTACSQVEQPQINYTDAPSVQFLSLCSGLEDMTNETVQLVAVASCLARVRGFVDGHQVTIRMQKPGANTIHALWCVDATVTDKEVLDSVMSWVDANPADYKKIIDAMPGTTAALAITTKAVHDAYPCTGA